MQSTVPSAKVAVEALQAQYGVSTASPDQQAAAAAAAGAAPKPSVMDRVIVMHVVGRVVLHGEVRSGPLRGTRMAPPSTSGRPRWSSSIG
jgi:hypothetical protein